MPPNAGIGMVMLPAAPLDTAAHVIQLALTPIFLLTAVGSLLNVFATRLARVSDRMHGLAGDADRHRERLRRLRNRSRTLEGAVLCAAIAGALTCCAAATLFFGVLRDARTATLLFGFFGGALLFAIGALACFALEIVLSGRSTREMTRDDRA